MTRRRRSDGVARGVDYPQREEDRLRRLVTRRFRGTREAWLQHVLPLLEAGDYAGALAAVERVSQAAEAYSDDLVSQDFAASARAVDRRHELRWWAAVGAAAGVTVMLSSRRGRQVSSGRRGTVIVPQSLAGADMIDRTATDGVRYISTLRSGVGTGLRSSIRESVARIEAGEDRAVVIGELAAKIQRSGVPSRIPIRRLKKNGVPVEVGIEAHARLIASDQIGKAQAQIEHARAVEAGAQSYRWRTQGDADVRPEHRELNGRIFPYAEGPRPGEPYRCRCYAEPVISAQQLLASSGVVNIGLDPVYAEETRAVSRAQQTRAARRRAQQLGQ